ncbi:MAG: CopG family transcriptional regulator [Acidimicrobiia bacterium]
MERTQIYLTQVEVDLLRRESERTGASKAELIRRAIQAHYGESGPQDRRAALRRTAGSWNGRSFTGAAYTRALRGDLERRLSDLGLA